jgi:metal-responsive CopG/Arc/MetJ family transcriptional regulator
MTSYGAAMRTIIDLPDEDIKSLDLLAKRAKLSRAELIRRAVTAFIETETLNQAVTHDIFGLYADIFTQDALEHEKTFRAECHENDFKKPSGESK